jgi:hypothetical protein
MPGNHDLLQLPDLGRRMHADLYEEGSSMRGIWTATS